MEVCTQGNMPVVVHLDIIFNRSLRLNFRSLFNEGVAPFFLLNAILSACVSFFCTLERFMYT